MTVHNIQGYMHTDSVGFYLIKHIDALFHIPISGLPVYGLSINSFVTQYTISLYILVRRILLEISTIPFNTLVLFTSKFRLSILTSRSVQFVYIKFLSRLDIACTYIYLCSPQQGCMGCIRFNQPWARGSWGEGTDSGSFWDLFLPVSLEIYGTLSSQKSQKIAQWGWCLSVWNLTYRRYFQFAILTFSIQDE